MKVYLRTANNDKSIIENIKYILKKDNHTVDSDVIDTKDNDRYSSEITNTILKYDILIVEASFSNAQLGFETAFALEKNIPVVVLYNDEINEKGFFPLIAVKPTGKFIIKGYKLKQLETCLKEIMSEMEGYLNNRFTLCLTPQIADFLTWISETEKINKADFIKNLIETALKKNTKYKSFMRNKHPSSAKEQKPEA